MTFLLLLAPSSPACVREMVLAHGEVLYESVGVHGDEEIKRVFQAASRLPGGTLVVDIHVASGEGLVRVLHAFRIARPECKVIVLVGDRQPGDETASALVSLGVYNLCEGSNDTVFNENFRRCLRGEGSYAAASRWHRGFREETEQRTRETVIIERRPLGRVTVAVAGLAAGVGCTHTALMLGAFLAKTGAAAVVEDSQRPVFESIVGLATGKCRSPKGFRLGPTDVFALPRRWENEGYLYDQVAAELAEYDYVVRDLGVIDVERLRELYRAQCAVVVGAASSWRIMDLVRQHNSLREDFGKTAVVSAFGTEQDRRLFKEATGILPLQLAWCPDPTAIPEAGEEVLRRILGTLLPERKRQRTFKLF